MTRMSEPVERQIELEATPEEVWRELDDPRRLGEWLGARVELDLEPGGTGTFSFPGGETRRARVVDFEAGRRISFAWGPVTPVAGPPTTVTIMVEPAGEGTR